MRILELGCGNAAMWKKHVGALPEGCELLLTDLSDGMLEEAQRQLGKHERVRYAQVDAMDILCGDARFDAVIANMMLYHVPDIDRALAEIRRVLKPDGWFACATNGEQASAAFWRRSLRITKHPIGCRRSRCAFRWKTARGR